MRTAGRAAEAADQIERQILPRRRATGYSPIDYVDALRIEEAKQMLETSALPVEAVADAIGYAEPATFIRLFRRLAGVTPAQWRKRFSAEAMPRL